jgi:ABC-type transport system involved in multi-copper enzyme maturation permease subunit
MAVFTIAGLTLKEAIRRRTLVGAVLMGLLVLGLSLLLLRMRFSMQETVAQGRRAPEWFALEYPLARSFITSLCLSSIKSLGALFAVLLAGGAVSSEIERGLLAVILPKPIHRWQILLGKWIGLNCILIGSTLLWAVMVWASLTVQKHYDKTLLATTPLLKAGLVLTLFPMVVCTLALSLSTFAPRLFGTSLALTFGAFAWFDGIFNALANAFNVESLRTLAKVAGMVVPQGYIAWRVDDVMRGAILVPPQQALNWESPRFVQEWGAAHLHFAYLDLVYIALYIVVVFLAGAAIFQRRDVQ